MLYSAAARFGLIIAIDSGLHMADSSDLQEIQRRRTFAIISHPDAAQPFNA